MGQDQSSPLAAIYKKQSVDGKPIMPHNNMTDAEKAAAISELCGNVSKDTLNVLGGGESFVGGYDALQDYGNSIFSRAKEQLIRDIAADVFKALKVSNAKEASSAPISTVIKHLEKLVPNPRKGKRFNESFNSSSAKQREVCEAVASAINRHYGGSIINMGSSPNEMCNQVGEVMYSLFTGLHTEFLNIAGDVARIMKNMTTVNEALDAAYKKQVELINASGEEGLKEQSGNTTKLYEDLKGEYDRQLAVLTNLMNVTISPTAKTLVSALEENSDFAGLVKDLKSELGTTAFGDKLGHLLSGISTVAHSAELIDKALKKIGMSVGEFRTAKDANELRKRIYDHILKAGATSKKLDEMMEAAQIIYNNNYDHQAVSNLLSKGTSKSMSKKRGGDDGVGDSGTASTDSIDKSAYGGGDDDSINGGAEEDVVTVDDALGTEVSGGLEEDRSEYPKYWNKKSLTNKIKAKEKYRTMILKDFRKLLREHYRRIVEVANTISKHVGVEIPVSDELEYFVKVFSTLENLDKENLHVALSGYAKDSVSKEKREQFMNNYILVDEAIQPLTKGPYGTQFKQLQSEINGLIKTIDNFSDKMVKAITEIHVDHPDEILREYRKTANTFYGSGEGGDDLFGSGSWVTFDKVKNEMKYFYSIANIKTNMARNATDIKSYAADYENLLGEEGGWLINQIKKEFIDLIENADPSKPEVATSSVKTKSVRTALTGAANSDAVFKNLRKIWEMQMNAKVNLAKAAQAVDLYMKSFTDGIAHNPDVIKSVVNMLDQVETVARWFTDRSGDSLSFLFEMFPNKSTIVGNVITPTYSYGEKSKSIVTDKGEIKLPLETNEHYYCWLENQWVKSNENLPGNPFLGRPLGDMEPKQLDGLVLLTEKTIKSMRALENILSAFFAVGSKFGNIDPAANTFMTSGQILNALFDYIKASAFATQFLPSESDRQSAPYVGRVTADSILVTGTNVRIPQASPNDRHPRTTNQDQATYNFAHTNNMRIGEGLIRVLPQPAALRTPTNARGIVSGVGTPLVEAAAGDAVKNKYATMAMSGLPGDSFAETINFWKYHAWENRDNDRIDMAGWQDAFYDTDSLFLMTIKSIVAKVFTVVDAYRLFHRPTMDRSNNGVNTQVYSLHPLRTILGGTERSVKVIPEAYELYLRLPLLAEWYREQYSFNSNVGYAADSWRLALAPNIDGIWSDFISIVFDKAGTVREGNYSESQVQEMILAMNNIYKVYKSRFPKATIRNIINAFVLEINRAFGFMKQNEIDAYMKNRREYLNPQLTPDDDAHPDPSVYDILNADDQIGTGRPAPSDRFVNVGLKPNTIKRLSMQKFYEEIDLIKRRMDADFIKNALSTDMEKYRFSETLRNYKKDIDNAKNEEEQYKIVLQIIQGANKTVSMNSEKLIMVHEMVAAPLAALYVIYKVVAKYNALLHGTSLMNLEKWSDARTTTPAVGIALNNSSDVRTSYTEYLKTSYTKVITNTRVDQLRTFAETFASNLDVPFRGVAGYFVAPAAILANTQCLNSNIDAAYIIQDHLQALLDLTGNPTKLVTCSVGTTGNINVDFGPLSDLCYRLLTDIKQNIQKLRGLFAPNELSIVDKYEKLDTVGSTRWLEEQLFEIIFKDRDETGLNTANSLHLQKTFEKASKNGVLGGPLTNNCGYNTLDNAFRGLIFYEANSTPDRSLPNTFTVCNPTKFPFNVISMRKTAEAADEKVLVAELSASRPNAANASSNITRKDMIVPLFHAPIIYFDAEKNMNELNVQNMHYEPNNRVMANPPTINSLLLRFNKLVHMYMFDSLEDGSLKTYAPLFENFVNSAASREVLQGKAFPDVRTTVSLVGGARGPIDAIRDLPFPAGIAGPLKGPVANSLLSASNALALRSLMTSIQTLGTTQKKKHLYDSLADMPEFMKEKLRVNLPMFSKQFQYIADRADLLKRILNYTNLKNNIASAVAAGAVETDPDAIGGTPFQVDALEVTAGKNTSDMAQYFNALLTKLHDMSNAIRKCSDAVYKELNDKLPYFMETSKDFIADYKRRFNVMPFIVPSLMLIPVASINRQRNNDTPMDASHLLLPSNTNGSDVYKVNYGLRVIFNDPLSEFNIEHFPTAKDLYNGYSSYADNTNKITAADFGNTLKVFVKAAKFLGEGTLIAKLYSRPIHSRTGQTPADYSGSSVFNEMYLEVNHQRDWTIPPATPAEKAIYDTTLAVYSLAKKELPDFIELVENSTVKYSKERLAQFIGVPLGNIKQDGRAQLRTFNILDMNIVPINVHAFMREIPFVNILNYSYTFDRMVHDFVLPNYLTDQKTSITESSLMIKPNTRVTSTRELMVKLLCHPYAFMDNKNGEYYAVTASLFNGNDDMKLGRPRYLSDQLIHKALLTSSVQLAFNNKVSPFAATSFKSIEGGPAAYEAQRAVVQFSADNLPITDASGNTNLNRNVQNIIAQAVLRLFVANHGLFSDANLDSAKVKVLEKITNNQLVFDNDEQYLYVAHIWRGTGTGFNEIAFRLGAFSDNLSDTELQNLCEYAGLPRNTRVTPEERNIIKSLKQVARDARTKSDDMYAQNMRSGIYHDLRDLIIAILQAPVAGADPARINNCIANITRVPLPANAVSRSINNSLRAYATSATARTDSNSILHISDGHAFPALVAGTVRYVFPAGVCQNFQMRVFLKLMEIMSNKSLGSTRLTDWEVATMIDLAARMLDDEAAGRVTVIPVGRSTWAMGADARMRAAWVATHPGAYQVFGTVENIPSDRYCYEVYKMSPYTALIPAAIPTTGNAALDRIGGILYTHAQNPLRYIDNINTLMSNDTALSNTQNLKLADFPVSTQGLKFFKDNKWVNTGTNSMHPADIIYCAELGKSRFDTKLVRNLTWMVQLQRIMRVVLIGHLSWLNTPVVTGLKIADPKLTEYDGNEKFEEDDFNGASFNGSMV